ncbi:hypothetical protein BJF80_00655 [Serinicoccus sp. CUA-874]|nr:hypothetical protein BJF80_00655 [Serinicoccus sp. CUA-874]
MGRPVGAPVHEQRLGPVQGRDGHLTRDHDAVGRLRGGGVVRHVTRGPSAPGVDHHPGPPAQTRHLHIRQTGPLDGGSFQRQGPLQLGVVQHHVGPVQPVPAPAAQLGLRDAVPDDRRGEVAQLVLPDAVGRTPHRIGAGVDRQHVQPPVHAVGRERAPGRPQADDRDVVHRLTSVPEPIRR